MRPEFKFSRIIRLELNSTRIVRKQLELNSVLNGLEFEQQNVFDKLNNQT